MAAPSRGTQTHVHSPAWLLPLLLSLFFLSGFVGAPADVGALVGDGPVTTDDRRLVEYCLSRPHGEAAIDLSALYGDVRPFIRSSARRRGHCHCHDPHVPVVEHDGAAWPRPS